MIGFAVASQIPWSGSVGAIRYTTCDERIRVIHEFPMLCIVRHTFSIIAFLRTLHRPG